MVRSDGCQLQKTKFTKVLPGREMQPHTHTVSIPFWKQLFSVSLSLSLSFNMNINLLAAINLNCPLISPRYWLTISRVIIISYVIYENVRYEQFLFGDEFEKRERGSMGQSHGYNCAQSWNWPLETWDCVASVRQIYQSENWTQSELIGRLDSGIESTRRRDLRGGTDESPKWRVLGDLLLSMMWWLIGSKSRNGALWKRCSLSTLQTLTRRLICGQAVGFVQLMIDGLKYILQ